jgi:hypothetical protein
VTAAIVAGLSTLVVNVSVDRSGLIAETGYVPGLIVRGVLVALLMWTGFWALDAMRR